MAFSDVMDLWKYWDKFPPPHLILRGLFQPKRDRIIKPGVSELTATEHLAISHQAIPSNELPQDVQKWLKDLGGAAKPHGR